MYRYVVKLIYLFEYVLSHIIFCHLSKTGTLSDKSYPVSSSYCITNSHVGSDAAAFHSLLSLGSFCGAGG